MLVCEPVTHKAATSRRRVGSSLPNILTHPEIATISENFLLTGKGFSYPSLTD